MDFPADQENETAPEYARFTRGVSDLRAAASVAVVILLMTAGAAGLGYFLGLQGVGVAALAPPSDIAAAAPQSRRGGLPCGGSEACAAQRAAAIEAAVKAGDATAAPPLGAPRAPAGRQGDVAAKAIPLGQTFVAASDDRPPPFFFAEDEIADRAPPPPISEVYAEDVGEGPHTVEIALRKGETFVDALARAGVGAADRNAAAAAFGAHQNMRALRPGQSFRMTVAAPSQTLFQNAAAGENAPNYLLALDFRSWPGERLTLRREADGGFAADQKTVPLTARIVSVAGAIHGSLYESAKKVGAPDEVIAQLADVFAYDVDFQREIFGGDEFEAVFEVRYDDKGAAAYAGEVLYARLNYRGRQKEKAYYRLATTGGGADYFDGAGQSAKRLLMKTPVDGARLSSGFGTRLHPVLGYMKAHKGVDFAAPTGTPVKAAGDGVVERAGPFSTFGNYVKIRHSSGYETAYAHLSRFAPGVHAGTRVRQGDIIAYIGTTGRSTGPHLHYEVHYKGEAVNPQNLKVATGVELSGKDLKRFKAARDDIDALRRGAERQRNVTVAGGEDHEGL